MEAMSPSSVSTKQQRIAELARQLPKVAFTSLAHHMDVEWLRTAHKVIRKDAAVGIDGQTAQDYGENLEANLQSLLKRAKDGDPYKAPPVRRVYIPKADGSKRPLGIPTFDFAATQKPTTSALEKPTRLES